MADMSRCPAIVVVVTVEPAGHRFEPREVNVIWVPGVGSMP